VLKLEFKGLPPIAFINERTAIMLKPATAISSP
jgi:hypothetical protein